MSYAAVGERAGERNPQYDHNLELHGKPLVFLNDPDCCLSQYQSCKYVSCF